MSYLLVFVVMKLMSRCSGNGIIFFFIFDAVKKIILSYRVSSSRDVFSAVLALDDALSKFKKLPEKLSFLFDGNPIYVLAQHFFAQHDIFFDLN